MSDEQLTTLKRKRGLVEARFTLFKTYVTNLKTTVETSNSEIHRNIYIELESRLERANRLLLEFEQIQTDLEEIVGLDKFQEQMNERRTFENEFFQTIAEAKGILTDGIFEQNKKPTVLAPNNNPLLNTPGPIGLSGVRLPQINLPKFLGNYDTWLEFRDTFESLIHFNTSIGDIQKFHYLRASLDGDAKQVIHSLEFSEKNYNVAWDLLKQRYDNVRLLVQNHIRAIHEIPSLNRESSGELRKMVDTVKKHLRSLENLGQPTEKWDTLLLYTLAGKLDKTTLREWEEEKNLNELPTLNDFYTFLKGRSDLLETLEMSLSGLTSKSKAKEFQRETLSKSKSFVTAGYVVSCQLCKENHRLSYCAKFQEKSVNDRITFVKNSRLCLNCLKPNHTSRECTNGTCRKCNLNHHTTLHINRQNQNSARENTRKSETQTTTQNQNVTQNSAPISNENNSQTQSFSCQYNSEVLLSTAIILVRDYTGEFQKCRVLLDSASQSSFITSALLSRLGLRSFDVNISVLGIGQTTAQISKRCNLHIKSMKNAFSTEISCFVIPHISDNIPGEKVNIANLEIPSNLSLADPTYFQPGSIDMLLGASLFYKLLCVGQISLGHQLPTLQKTRFGWVISGSVNTTFPSQGTTMCHFAKTSHSDVQAQLAKFWELEEAFTNSPIWSEDEKACESLFLETVSREKDGKFQVTIPFKKSTCLLGESKKNALRRLYSTENRLLKNPSLKLAYCEFMENYEKSGHMSQIEPADDELAYYLPHHAVINENSSTTKVRVVFDGSSPTDTGISLNELQYVGPPLQEDLVSILLRFRLYNIVFCADIAQMYRQVWVAPHQRHLQRILWRSNNSDQVRIYNLNTVTFGLTSSPFLAIRCLRELANECAMSNPIASNVISHSFYVDDLVSGADSVEEAIKICNDVSNILKSGGFELRKWNSNSNEVLKELHCQRDSQVMQFGEKTQTKTLGLYWSSDNDVLMYSIGNQETSKLITKRTILSHIAQIFDPLGILSASIIISKIILQHLWTLKLAWDEPIPPELFAEWMRFKQELPVLNSLKIPRQVICESPSTIELHGFADASTQAYGTCIYLKSIDATGEIYVNLLCAKGRVAPLKTITIPKLELCGALLLAQLMHKVKTSLRVNINSIHLWSDSTVALGWIKSQPNRFQIFVANRVSQIQSLTQSEQWNHVSTDDNPADLVSRGIYPSQLKNNILWFKGPPWLSQSRESWPCSQITPESNLPEMKKSVKSFMTRENLNIFPFEKFSKMKKMIRMMALCLRFLSNCKVPKNRASERCTGILTPSELNNATNRLAYISQKETFMNELHTLQQGKHITKGRLSSLNPFLDSNGIIRVGGRLQLSDFAYEKMHPIVISAKHPFSKLLFQYEHENLCHAGPQLLFSSIKDKYWPVSGRNLARKTVYACVKCFRANPLIQTPIMGVLPKERIDPKPAFYTTGVDFAGPFQIKNKTGRGSSLIKAYIALFVCFSTRAIHLELVTSLSTEAFIAAFRRFVSRRGKPQTVYSDNGKNFVGAATELKQLGQFLTKEENSLKNSFSNDGVNWCFTPPYSPHFGGIWEAGVKATKYHLKRVTTTSNLTYEEFSTFLIQIEAILNSRPLTPISSHPFDLEALTPSHFLIGRRLTSLPDPSVLELPQNRLSKFQAIQQMHQRFWSRWSLEYINNLQQRVKWKSNQHQLQLDTMVVIKDDNLPPLQWQLGRVIKLHPGPDGISRVATIQTQKGPIKRSFAKICPLPVDQSEDEDLAVSSTTSEPVSEP